LDGKKPEKKEKTLSEPEDFWMKEKKKDPDRSKEENK